MSYINPSPLGCGPEWWHEIRPGLKVTVSQAVASHDPWTVELLRDGTLDREQDGSPSYHPTRAGAIEAAEALADTLIAEEDTDR